jgi:hypothetical protein
MLIDSWKNSVSFIYAALKSREEGKVLFTIYPFVVMSHFLHYLPLHERRLQMLEAVMVGAFGTRCSSCLQAWISPGVLHNIQSNVVKLGALDLPAWLD